MWSFVSGFFHLLFSRFVDVTVCISTSFPFYDQIITHRLRILVCLSICQLVDSWVISVFWLLCCLWTFTCKFLCGQMFSFGYIPRCGLAGPHGNAVYLSKELLECFSQQLYHFTFPSVMYVPASPHPCRLLLLFIFLFIPILVGIKSYFIVALSIFKDLLTEAKQGSN